jgi:integrase
LVFKSNKSEIKSTKSKAGIRKIPIANNLLPSLKDYVENLEDNVLFPMVTKDNYMTESSYKSFRKAVNKTIRDHTGEDVVFTPHNLRHTFATNLYYSNIKVLEAQYLLGHSNIKTTLEIYTHLDRENISSEFEKLNEYIG